MKLGKILKNVLTPPLYILLPLIPVAAVLLIWSMLNLSDNAPMCIFSYTLSAYALTALCFRAPGMIMFFRNLCLKNKYINKFFTDMRFRFNVMTFINVMWNGSYAALQLGMGFYHKSFWFFSLSGYYITLALMRFALFSHLSKHIPGDKIEIEFKRYRYCGFVLLFTNLALSVIMIYMIKENKAFYHNEITTIAIAAYTFTSMTVSIYNIIRHRNSSSPVISASKIISLVAASVSMLTLEQTMLTTFGKDNMTFQEKRIFLSVSGGFVSLLIITMSIYMIIRSAATFERKNKL